MKTPPPSTEEQGQELIVFLCSLRFEWGFKFYSTHTVQSLQNKMLRNLTTRDITIFYIFETELFIVLKQRYYGENTGPLT